MAGAEAWGLAKGAVGTRREELKTGSPAADLREDKVRWSLASKGKRSADLMIGLFPDSKSKSELNSGFSMFSPKFSWPDRYFFLTKIRTPRVKITSKIKTFRVTLAMQRGDEQIGVVRSAGDMVGYGAEVVVVLSEHVQTRQEIKWWVSGLQFNKEQG